jgi:hypothetical protein
MATQGGSGLGNGNAKSGNKGSNHNYEHRVLLALGKLVAAGSTAGLATEATLLSVLDAIVASDQDIEILLVRDTGNNDEVVQQITNYETGVPVVSYKDVNGNPYVPVGPLEYLDPSAVLNLILTQVTAINNAIHLEVDDDAIAVEQELPTNINLLYGAFEGEGVEWERIQTDGNGYLKGISDILIEVGLINTKLTPTLRVPLLQRVAGAASSSVASGKRSVSFYNAGTTDATVTTGTLKPGESITFDAGGQGDTLGAIPYVTLAGGDLVITSIA